MFLIERILCPVDFSDLSSRGLAYGLSFALRYRARLCVLHVLDLLPAQFYSFEFLEVHAQRIEAEMAEEARGKMERLVAEEVGGQCEVEVAFRKGKPFVEIIRLARERDMDLIVIPTHGAGGRRFPWMGSTAERVVRKAPCPVLTVRDPEHEFVIPEGGSDVQARS